jgi:glycosyltransferase involved in cell wall biosynthesis
VTTFSVLLPVHRPPVFLPFSVASVLSQDMPDFELIVVCDGAPAETVTLARRLAEQDDGRVRVLDCPKGERHGEAHRAHALDSAQGKYVAHINDDSLWFPDHLSSLTALLENVDFGHVTHTWVDEADQPQLTLGDLENVAERKRMLETAHNIANLSDVAYSIDAYRQLPEGWAPAQPGVWSDLNMWRKFLRQEGLRFGTLFKSTTLVFDRPISDMSQAALAQISRWEATLRNPIAREQLRQRLWGDVVRKALNLTVVDLEKALDRERALNRRLKSLITAKVPDDFDPDVYVSLHDDLKRAGADGLEHYLKFGFYEGRRYR